MSNNRKILHIFPKYFGCGPICRLTAMTHCRRRDSATPSPQGPLLVKPRKCVTLPKRVYLHKEPLCQCVLSPKNFTLPKKCHFIKKRNFVKQIKKSVLKVFSPAHQYSYWQSDVFWRSDGFLGAGKEWPLCRCNALTK